MDKFNDANRELINRLEQLDLNFLAERDLSDLANEIGVVVSKYFSDDIGFRRVDFTQGLWEGVVLGKKRE